MHSTHDDPPAGAPTGSHDLLQADPNDPRRAAPRIDARVDIELWVNRRVNAESATTANLSVGGMFVSTSHPLPVGTVARFVLQIPGDEPIRGLAEVHWIRARYESADRPNGMGMRFMRLSAEAESALHRYLTDHMIDAKRARVQVREQQL